ncbi:hypothetical protein SAMN04488515_1217 [Cognatiyoonia koreensis]|uniref:TVP38/TMEM64 family membrane protein n=1 Tax=Cognatiyoonia koreensis TaxID=364200 RepID=A0A1I0PGQ5_9RHOB|nr:hypothetical protein [Cognatiyoonia koreensis]SEW13429.1 hypothetical protein SAMN04488515_1217 [Cognatiyoonia koreensis]
MSHQPLDLPPTPWHKALPRIAIRLIAVIGIALLVRWIFGVVYTWIGTLDTDAQASAMIWLIAISIAAYALLIAIPFVPAVEIGIALMMIEGPVMAPFVYAATVLGLFLAFWIGQRVSLDWLITMFRDLRMMNACALVLRIKKEPRDTLLARLNDNLPDWIAPIATRYRYVTIGVLLSVPGNFAIGGGGGIMMTAGISRLFSGPAVFLTLLIAVLPIPLIVWLFGVDFFA